MRLCVNVRLLPRPRELGMYLCHLNDVEQHSQGVPVVLQVHRDGYESPVIRRCPGVSGKAELAGVVLSRAD